jgi:hypothetical protein
MTGRAVPSDDELRARLNKRMFLLPGGPFRNGRLPTASRKRYNPATAMVNGFKSKAANVNFLANGTAGNSSSASGTSQGVSPIDLQAATAGGLTAANPPTAANSIGLSIESADTGC